MVHQWLSLLSCFTLSLVLDFRIRINKQLEVEPDEPEIKQKTRRKQKRSKRENEEQLDVKDQTVEVVLEPLETSLGEVLMVEVDNVDHEDFQITEEVKVSKGTGQASCLEGVDPAVLSGTFFVYVREPFSERIHG